MKKRLISAGFLLPVLVILLLVAPKLLTAFVWAALMAVASYELLYRTGLVQEVRLVAYASAMAFAVSLWSFLGSVHAYGVLLFMAYLIVLYTEMMLSHVKLHFETICLCMVSGALMPFMMGGLMRIYATNIGRYLIPIPFVVAFMSDAGAYFAGRYFGQRKLAPVISGNKTVEGAVGGVLSAVAGMLIYAAIMQYGFQFRVNYLYAIVYGAFGSVAGVFGDLCFSVVKRQTGIKDYGNLIPGHGGIWDRFDSMLMVAPLMEAFLIILPMVV